MNWSLQGIRGSNGSNGGIYRVSGGLWVTGGPKGLRVPEGLPVVKGRVGSQEF